MTDDAELNKLLDDARRKDLLDMLERRYGADVRHRGEPAPVKRGVTFADISVWVLYAVVLVLFGIGIWMITQP